MSVSPSRARNARTAAAESTAANAAARTLSSACLTRGRYVHGFATRQLGPDVPVARQEALEVTFDDIRRNQHVAPDAQPGRDARPFADHGDARLQVARLGAIRPRVVAVAQTHVRANDDVFVEDGPI